MKKVNKNLNFYSKEDRNKLTFKNIYKFLKIF
jgi:hypothetical protein